MVKYQYSPLSFAMQQMVVANKMQVIYTNLMFAVKYEQFQQSRRLFKESQMLSNRFLAINQVEKRAT